MSTMENTLPKMRTIRDCAKEIKNTDSSTAITESSIRKLVNEKIVPCIKIGNRCLVDLDFLINYIKSVQMRGDIK